MVATQAAPKQETAENDIDTAPVTDVQTPVIDPVTDEENAPSEDEETPAVDPGTGVEDDGEEGRDMRVYTMTEVERHQGVKSCWAVVDGKVYDLTDWIGKHPGGEQAILSLCGTDATAKFHDQHGDAAPMAQALAGFQIGVLKD